MQDLQPLLAIAVAVLIALIPVFYGLINTRFNKVEATAETIHEVKENYLDRFKEVTELINKNHFETLGKINELNTKVTKQSTICRLVQERKKQNV